MLRKHERHARRLACRGFTVVARPPETTSGFHASCMQSQGSKIHIIVGTREFHQ